MGQMEQFIEQLESRPIWEQRPGESDMQFERLEIFRLLGPGRTINKAYQSYRARYPDRKMSKLPPHSWYDMRLKGDFDLRCKAYDEQQRQEIRAAHDTTIAEAQKRNQAALDMALGEAEKVIATSKNNSEKRLWIDTLSRLTAEIRREHGYDINRVQEVDPLEVINLQWPEEADNAD